MTDDTEIGAPEILDPAPPLDHDSIITVIGGAMDDVEPVPDQPSDKSLRLAAVAGATASVIGLMGTWTSGDGVTLNAFQGPQNGWLVVIYAVAALLASRALSRLSWAAIALTLISTLGVLTAVVGNSSVRGLGRGWGWWFSLLGGLILLSAAGWTVYRRVGGSDGIDRHPPALARSILAWVGVGSALIVYFAFRQVVWVGEDVSWPPPPDAVTSSGSEAATVAFRESGSGPHDVGLDYAWSTAASVEPFAEGSEFYPRIFADIEAAESSVHILMFGWKQGEVGNDLTDLLIRRMGEGIEVRVIVDGLGSRPFGGSAEMYERLADGGAEIVVNDTLPLDRDGIIGNRSVDWTHDELGHADHRKLYVIDGTVGWTGGAGIEDHFLNGEFHDVMVRFTGAVVGQTQAVFLTSFASHGAVLPADLGRYFPAPPDPGSAPAAVVQVVPGGFSSGGQSIRELIDGATDRLDIMNPYLTDRDMIERIINAAERGVNVRIVISEESNNFSAALATKYRYGDLESAGVEIWEYPGAVVHAKLIIADDTVHFGTINLDAWALYRDFEIGVTTTDASAVALFTERVFEPDIAASKRADPPGGLGNVPGWLFDKFTYFL